MGGKQIISIAVRESFGIPVAVHGTSDFFAPFVHGSAMTHDDITFIISQQKK
jgi:hypothetical protein